MRRSSSAGSFQQSFLDLLFGTLGAVVLLFVLISITSGPPPRPLTPVSREISWTISSEKIPATDFALYLPTDTGSGAFGPRIDGYSGDGEAVYTMEEVRRRTDCGFEVSSKHLSEDVMQVTAEVPSDDDWEKDLVLVVRFEQKLSKRPTVTVEATPGDISKSPEKSAETDESAPDGILKKVNEKEPSGNELGNCLRIETSIELRDVGDCLLPFMDASKFKVEFDGETQ